MLFAYTFFAALAAAASLPKRDGATISSSNAFRLKAKGISGHVEDNQYMNGLHIGAGQNIATFNPNGWVFYRNESTTLESGIVIVNAWPAININFMTDIPHEPDNRLVMISGSEPNVDLDVSEDDGVLTVTPPTWAICPKALKYYQGKVFQVLRNYKQAEAVPEDCTTIELLPICAELPQYPEQQELMGVIIEPMGTPCYVESA